MRWGPFDAGWCVRNRPSLELGESVLAVRLTVGVNGPADAAVQLGGQAVVPSCDGATGQVGGFLVRLV